MEAEIPAESQEVSPEVQEYKAVQDETDEGGGKHLDGMVRCKWMSERVGDGQKVFICDLGMLCKGMSRNGAGPTARHTVRDPAPVS